jgi:signal transduction histidine kinase
MAALPQEPAGLVHPNVSLAGAGERRLLVDVHMRCISPPEPSTRPAGRAGRLPEAGDSLVLVVVEDVSLRASAERRLAASERLTAQAKAAARMAHELNNPLDGVLRYVGLAQRLSAGQAGEHLAAAKDGLMRMAEIIREMLDASAASRGYRQPLAELLDEAVSAFAPRAEALGVRVECSTAEGADTAVDARMFQVFCNVIKNALDAMPSGGVLAIRTHVADGQCVLTFADTGCGLTAQQARCVFEPFYTTKPAGQGVGLGLTICREAVTALGGAIAIAPGAKGGAVVTITLPTRQPVPVGGQGD